MCKVFPFLIHWKIVWNCRWSWRRWSVRGFACCGACVVHLSSAMLPSVLLHSSDLLNHRCEILILVGQTHIHYHRVLWDSMWSSCNTNREPVTLSINICVCTKSPLEILDLDDKSLITPSEVCLSNACLLTICTNPWSFIRLAGRSQWECLSMM